MCCLIGVDMFSRKATIERQPSRWWFHPSKEKVDESKLFSHSPLDTSTDGIRLFTLEPTKHAIDSIRCTLQDFTFAQKPKYEALSYTWAMRLQ